MSSDKQKTTYEALGQHLLELRLQLGWSLRKAAQEIGSISHSRLQDFEKGQDPHSAIPTRPTEEQIRRIAKAYQADQAKLLRLAGYSTVGPLTDWEEKLIIDLRALEQSKRTEVEHFVQGLFSHQ